MHQFNYKITREKGYMAIRVFLETYLDNSPSIVQYMDIRWEIENIGYVEKFKRPQMVFDVGCFSMALLMMDFLRDFELKCIQGESSPETAIELLDKNNLKKVFRASCIKGGII